MVDEVHRWRDGVPVRRRDELLEAPQQAQIWVSPTPPALVVVISRAAPLAQSIPAITVEGSTPPSPAHTVALHWPFPAVGSGFKTTQNLASNGVPHVQPGRNDPGNDRRAQKVRSSYRTGPTLAFLSFFVPAPGVHLTNGRDAYSPRVLQTMDVGPSGEGGGFDTAFVIVFGLVALLVVSGFIFVVYAGTRSARAARRAGIDPFTNEAQLLAQAVAGRGQTLEQRLAELDDLHRRGVISTDEHRTARTRALEA